MWLATSRTGPSVGTCSSSSGGGWKRGEPWSVPSSSAGMRRCATSSETALTRPRSPPRLLATQTKEGPMADRLISGDNHIDLTYCPPDLWSSQAPAKWKLIAPRTEELEDGLHWFVNAQDKGMWNGVGPGFLKYQKGTFGHIDEMKDYGFEWDYHRGARPRPTTPELRLADLDRDGVEKEIIYGCLMINDMIPDGELRAWSNKIYNDWAAEFAKRSDPNRVFPLAIVPNNDPVVAAA